jgi:anthranilate/para-aminobenzoate synthase component I
MTEEEYEVSVRTIDHPGIDPVTALARLRSYTPGRACFVLESRAPDTDEGRYSIVGYRVRSGASLPPAADVEGELSAIEGEAPQETFAQSLALASVGYVDAQAITRAKGVRLHEDMTATGVFAVRSVVMLYDHHENKVHVAGRVQGKAVERLIWELEHADDIPDMEVTPGARPDKVQPQVGDKRLAARAGRVQTFVGEEIERAILREELVASMGDADGLDVYRALSALDQQRDEPHTHGFFIDFGATPFSRHNRIAGLSSTLIHQRRRGEEGPAWKSFLDTIPGESFFGSPPIEAARVLREVEDGGRLLWGAVVGYACPGGESTWMLVDKAIFMNGDSFVCNVGVEVNEDTDASTLADLAFAEAADQLAALVSAQKHAEAYPKPKVEVPQLA